MPVCGPRIREVNLGQHGLVVAFRLQKRWELEIDVPRAGISPEMGDPGGAGVPKFVRKPVHRRFALGAARRDDVEEALPPLLPVFKDHLADLREFQLFQNLRSGETAPHA